MDSYHVRLQGRCLGPYTLDRIRQMTRKGEVGRTHEVSTDGLSWAPATSFPEIFERSSPVAAQRSGPEAAPMAAAVVVAPTPSAPPSDEPQWYCDRGGSAHGPVPRTHLVAMIQRGEILTNSFVFKEGTAAWVLAGEAPELQAAFQPNGPAVGQPGLNAFCRECGAAVSHKAFMCPKCGAPTGAADLPMPSSQPLQFTFPVTAPAASRHAGDRKSKTVAAILALFFGGFGIHHFYLGNAGLGILYILFFWTLIPAFVALIEAIMYLCMSDADFDRKFNY